MNIKKWATVVAVLALTACASTPPKPQIDWLSKTPSEIAAAMTVSDSEFDRIRSLEAPLVEVSNSQPGMSPPLVINERRSVRLTALKAKATGGVEHVAIVTITYLDRGWRSYTTASFVDSQPPATVTAKRTVSCLSVYACWYTEAFALDISDSVLGNGTRDLRFRLNATNAPPVVVTLPASYVQGFLMGLEADKAQQPRR